MKHHNYMLLGVVLAAVTIVVLVLLPRQKTIEFTSVLMAFIAAPYAGFALHDGRSREIAIEVAAIGFFVAMALLGLWLNPFFLVVGLVLHGVWDLIHHPHGIQTQITDWYPPFCAVYDWLVGGYVLAWLLI